MKKYLLFTSLVLFLSSINLEAQVRVMMEIPEINSPMETVDKDIREIVIVDEAVEEIAEIKSSEDVENIIEKLDANNKNLTAQGEMLFSTLKFYKEFGLEYEDISVIFNEPDIINQVQNHIKQYNTTNDVVRYYTWRHVSDETAYVDFENMFYEYPFEEKSFRYKYNGPKMYIPNPLILKDSSSVQIDFQTTYCDKTNANQIVADILIETMQDCLQEANSNLVKLGFDPIRSITVSCTTNGHCSPKQRESNHHSGTAIDISAVNGIGVDYAAQRKTRRYIFEIQNAFNLHKYIRECFGPSFNDKTDFRKGLTTSMMDRYKKIVVPHYNHLHVAVRNE